MGEKKEEIEEIVKCVVVGDGFVGKTCLLMRLTKKQYAETYQPTIFDNSSINVVHNGKSYEILFIDSAGQEEYSLLRKQAYDSANVFLVCFSVSNTTTFSNVKEVWIPEIQSNSESVPKVLIGTKTDLRHDPETIDKMNIAGEIFVSKAMAVNLAKSYNMRYIECSSKTEEHMDEIIKTMLDAYSNSKVGHKKCNYTYSTCINPVVKLFRRAFCCRNSY